MDKKTTNQVITTEAHVDVKPAPATSEAAVKVVSKRSKRIARSSNPKAKPAGIFNDSADSKKADTVDVQESYSSAINASVIFRTIVLVILGIVSILPFYFMFVNATQTSDAVKAGIHLWFGSNLGANFKEFTRLQQGTGISAFRSMLNSLLVAVPYTALSVYFSSLTAYGLHAYEFKGKKFAWGFILAVMMVPTQVYAVGFYKFMVQLNLIDTYWPLIIPAITTPTVVFFMRQYLKGALPLAMVEAARIDGSGEFATFNRIVLPIMKPAMATQAILQFVACWNNLYMPSMIITSTGKKTLPMFVQMLMGNSFRTDYGVVFLALSITILPMFVIYFLLSRYIVEGVSLGSVKG